MRIAFFISGLEGGGAEFVARRWIEGLANRGHEVEVWTYERSPQGQVAGAQQLHHLKGPRGLRRWLRIVPWYTQRNRRGRPDVVVSMLTFSNLVALLGQRLIPRSVRPLLVISERNVATAYLPTEGKSGRLQVLLARWAYRGADGFVAISHAVAAEAVAGFGVSPDRITVIPNPVTTASTTPATASASVPQHLKLIFAGRLVTQKRPDLFLDTAKVLERRGHDVSVVIAGSGPLESRCRAMAKSLELNVQWLGWRSPWHTGLAGTGAVFLMTSSVEGFGNVLLEAAVAGIPCVAPVRALGVGDAIIPGITGVLATADTAEALADAVQEASNLRVDILELEGWRAHFSQERSVQRLEAALDSWRST